MVAYEWELRIFLDSHYTKTHTHTHTHTHELHMHQLGQASMAYSNDDDISYTLYKDYYLTIIYH